jgi:urease gamma subunit
MQLTPREFDKLLVYMMADVALKRRAKGLKLNYPEAVAVISAVALDGARAGKTIEDVTKEARTVPDQGRCDGWRRRSYSNGADRGGVHRRQPLGDGSHAVQ